ncbi:hypothetical protein E4198_21185 [Streptomyces sp. RKND-216]|uniref:DUF7144 domain-containing protein n=1 Tax=Streptomyces hazeniae TaxID=3075538 RepID=A0ABU2NVL9_9ACTN|nr:MULTISPECIES: hypothetical protein [unclassified Streptomyces]MDT0381031.1 hypothetical protein [Streptomyces sp. DSM 42041]THA26840.1 hypothetical protein E4198_21185 [Streptomyces sp. RKND-216]
MAHTVRQRPVDYGLAAGLTVFAGVMLLIAGVLDLLRGVMAIVNDDVIVTTPNYTFQFDTEGWGWVHLFVGAVAVIVSLGLFRANMAARVAGVVMAALVIISSFLSLPYYPVWSVVLIAMCGFVIWGLCNVRGEDVARGGD